ncbi:chymotrypsinogen B-like isoform X2 [Cloeon dipterum]|uniref:chymotrypsinogen B-like isoform X2 n=1 Tax=Cloeon dipterum TaxID=197152 RepID=UPI0032205CD8
MLNDRFNPICLFNQGRSINSRQTLQNDLATRFAKKGTQCFSDTIYREYCNILETIICSDDFESDYLVTIVGSRFFLRALTQSAIQEQPISYTSRHYQIFKRYFYSDIVADIPTIISASCDLAMMPIATDSPPKINFDNKTMGPSFPGCGMIVNGANRRPKRSDVDGYIHKGEPAARGRSPWHASLSKIKYGFLWRDFCGATLITERAAITAAHCLFDEGELLFPAKILVTFESFDLSARSDFERQTLKVTGRGFTENYTLPDTVRTADLRIASYQECFESNRKMASTYLKPNQNFCAGHPKNGTNVCNGDSGSGLIIQNEGKFYLRGIVSFGPTRKVKVEGQDLFACNPFQFSVFTDITFYLKWIAQSVPDLNKPTSYL